MFIEIWLSTPDANTADRWVKIGWKNKWPIRTPIRYSADNRIMIKLERFLVKRFYKYVDIGY